MAFIAFASAKGSPGVTTAVAALAATWPADRDLLVVEIDPAGGDLVVRFDLATEPGLVSLAAAGRRELTPDTLLGHTQTLPAVAGEQGPSRRVLVAPVSAEQAGAALSALRGGLARALGEFDADVLVDCGRLDPASAAHEVATGADLLVMVARPVVAEVHHLSSRLASVKPKALSLLMVGDRPYSVSEVAQAVGASALGTLPADARAASVLTDGHPNAVRVLRRSRLMRDARALSEGLAAWLGPAVRSGPPGSPPEAAAAAPSAPPGPPRPRDPSGTSRVPPGPPPPGPPVRSSSPVPPLPPPPSGPPVESVPPPPSHPHAAASTVGPYADPAAAAVPPGPPPERLRGNGRGLRDKASPKHFRRGDVEEPRR